MKRNINIVRNETNPPIPNPPDFDVMVKHVNSIKSKLMYKKIFIGAGVAIAASVAAILMFSSPAIKPNVNNLNNEIVTKVIPPSKELDIQYQTLTVDVKNGDTLNLSNGTQIIVPPNSIVNKDGSAVINSQLKYREFQNQTDIMLSGIPMTYDSAGVNYLLESGGMFELKSANENEMINEKIPVTVLLASNHQQEGFNAYKLDETKGTWSFIEPVKAQPRELEMFKNINIVDEPLKIQQKETELSKSTSIKNEPVISENKVSNSELILHNTSEKTKEQFNKKEPVLANENDFTFSVDPSQIEELKLYENISFKPLASEVNKIKDMPEELDYLTVTNTKEEGIYLVTFYINKRVEKVKCTPVFKDKEDYKKALAQFKRDEKAYKDKREKENRALEEQMKKEQLLSEKQERDRQKQRNNDIANQNKTIILKNNNELNYGTMIVAFSVKSFGYYNSDRPININQNNVIINYYIDDKSPCQPQLYQYFTKRNAVMVNYGLNTTTLKYTKEDDCLLVCLLNDGKSIAILDEDEFREQIINNKASSITLKKIDQKFENSIELNDFIESLIK